MQAMKIDRRKNQFRGHLDYVRLGIGRNVPLREFRGEADARRRDKVLLQDLRREHSRLIAEVHGEQLFPSVSEERRRGGVARRRGMGGRLRQRHRQRRAGAGLPSIEHRRNHRDGRSHRARRQGVRGLVLVVQSPGRLNGGNLRARRGVVRTLATNRASRIGKDGTLIGPARGRNGLQRLRHDVVPAGPEVECEPCPSCARR